MGLGLGLGLGVPFGGGLDPNFWVLASGGVRATLDIDFVNNRAYNSGMSSIASLLSCARSAPALTYYTQADGSLITFAANTLRTGTAGLLSEESRSNVFLNSDVPVTQSISVTAQAYTLSFYGTGTITLSGVSSAGPLTGSGGATTRVTLTFTPTAGSLTLTLSGSPQKVQLEAGSTASSYIPTAGTAVTRSADAVSFSDVTWLTNGSQSLYAEINLPASSTFAWLAYISDVSTNNNRQLLINNNNAGRLFTTGGGTGDGDAVTGNLISANTTSKLAAAFAANDLAIVLNNGTAATDATSTAPTGLNAAFLGSNNGSSLFANGYIRRFASWSSRLSNAALGVLTT
jgi:Concanavalin A-like lectin/glucanases superfamily